MGRIEECLDRMQNDYAASQMRHVQNYIAEAFDELKALRSAANGTGEAPRPTSASTPLPDNCCAKKCVSNKYERWCLDAGQQGSCGADSRNE